MKGRDEKGRFIEGEEIENRHEFPKGHIPWNKDKKGIHLSPQSEFKKGNVPANFVGFNIPRINNSKRDGPRRTVTTKEIRLGINKKTGKKVVRRRRPYYSRYLYEEFMGDVPKGHVVVHKDGNFLNDRFDNLECITRGQLMRKNYIRGLMKRWGIIQ